MGISLVQAYQTAMSRPANEKALHAEADVNAIIMAGKAGVIDRLEEHENAIRIKKEQIAQMKVDLEKAKGKPEKDERWINLLEKNIVRVTLQLEKLEKKEIT